MFLSDEEYNHVIGIMDGTISKSRLLLDLEAWTKENFGVTIYDYTCDRTVTGLTRMSVVVWDHKAHEFMQNGYNYDEKIQRRFQEKFAELARKYNVHPDYHNADDIFVTCETICDQIVRKTLWKVHVFYQTDEQVEQHKQDGKSEKLRSVISAIVKEHDKYNAFPNGVSCVFTSKQTLDEKYQGSMFYYTR
jgi:hypothetical protein